MKVEKSGLIPSLQWSDFQKMSDEQIRNSASFELWAGDDYLCTIVTPPESGGQGMTEILKARAAEIAARANSVLGNEEIKTVKEEAAILGMETNLEREKNQRKGKQST